VFQTGVLGANAETPSEATTQRTRTAVDASRKLRRCEGEPRIPERVIINDRSTYSDRIENHDATLITRQGSPILPLGHASWIVFQTVSDSAFMRSS